MIRRTVSVLAATALGTCALALGAPAHADNGQGNWGFDNGQGNWGLDNGQGNWNGDLVPNFGHIPDVGDIVPNWHGRH